MPFLLYVIMIILVEDLGLIGVEKMDQTNENPESKIDVGLRLREMRQDRNMSMRALARASGLSTNALSMIERGLTSPSVSTLSKLADALEVPITAFFRFDHQQRNIIHKRAGSRKQIHFLNGVWEGLGGDIFEGQVEPFILSLEPGSTSGDFGIAHSGHEFVMCLEGALEYQVENQVFYLEPLDSLLFAAHLKHKWKNPLETQGKALFVLSSFEKNEQPSEFHQQSVRKAG